MSYPFSMIWSTIFKNWKGFVVCFNVFLCDITYFSNNNKNVSDNITEVLKWSKEANISNTCKISWRTHQPWFTKVCNLICKCKTIAHKRFIRNPTPLPNEADIEVRNRYNKTKEKFNEHVSDEMMSSHNGSRGFWRLKQMNNNFNYFPNHIWRLPNNYIL